MASHELLQGLIVATVASSAAIVLVLALRLPMRRMFGAQVAYALWLLVPAALIATLLPAPVAQMAPTSLARVQVLPMQWMAASAAQTAVGLDWRLGLEVVWLLGAGACGLWLWRVQSNFRRSLEPLWPHDGLLRSQSTRAGLPATLGLWRPQVVLPADFETRFDADQRALVLAHERAHIARGDLRSNFVAALLRCLLWFNPLVHIAVLRMRNDQELACDADVLARQPHARRCYGDALLHSQLVVQASPLGCHFGFGHPLKERIAMLAKPVSKTQRWLGRSVLTCMLLGGGYAAWAAQPATQAVVVPVDGIAAEIILRVDENAPKVLRVVNKAGTPFALDTDSDGKHFAIAGAVTRIEHKGKPALALKLRIAEDGKQVAEPKLIVLNGKPASIQIGDEVVAQDGSKIFKGLRLDVTLHDAAAKASQAAQVDASSRKANPPSYPKEAQQQSIGGMTVLTVDVAANGSVIAAKVKRTSGNAQLDAAALEAVQRWLFKPAMKSGKATASQVTVPIEFDPGLKPEKRVAAVRAALARQAEAARPAAVAAMSSTNTNWGGYDAMMHSLRGNWITGQQPSTEGC